jgi:hypothetical protein
MKQGHGDDYIPALRTNSNSGWHKGWFYLRNDPEHALSALLTVKIRQPSHEFTFGVGISFIPYPLVLTPVV